MKNGNKLHQLIAVENDLVKQANNILEETTVTFTKKSEHFDGFTKVYRPLNEDGEELPPEIKNIITTVDEKLCYTNESIFNALNATISKEMTNSSGNAVAKLIVGDIEFGTFSSTAFLAMERFFVKYREMIKSIPTYDPTRVWSKDNSSGKDLFVAPKETRARTEKVKKTLMLSPATDKFPANVQVYDDTATVGFYDTLYSTGKFSPLEKSTLLTKVDEVIHAIKVAREEANQADVTNVDVASSLINYIMK